MSFTWVQACKDIPSTASITSPINTPWLSAGPPSRSWLTCDNYLQAQDSTGQPAGIKQQSDRMMKEHNRKVKKGIYHKVTVWLLPANYPDPRQHCIWVCRIWWGVLNAMRNFDCSTCMLVSVVIILFALWHCGSVVVPFREVSRLEKKSEAVDHLAISLSIALSKRMHVFMASNLSIFPSLSCWFSVKFTWKSMPDHTECIISASSNVLLAAAWSSPLLPHPALAMTQSLVASKLLCQIVLLCHKYMQYHWQRHVSKIWEPALTGGSLQALFQSDSSTWRDATCSFISPIHCHSTTLYHWPICGCPLPVVTQFLP